MKKHIVLYYLWPKNDGCNLYCKSNNGPYRVPTVGKQPHGRIFLCETVNKKTIHFGGTNT